MAFYGTGSEGDSGFLKALTAVTPEVSLREAVTSLCDHYERARWLVHELYSERDKQLARQDRQYNNLTLPSSNKHVQTRNHIVSRQGKQNAILRTARSRLEAQVQLSEPADQSQGRIDGGNRPSETISERNLQEVIASEQSRQRLANDMLHDFENCYRSITQGTDSMESRHDALQLVKTNLDRARIGVIASTLKLTNVRSLGTMHTTQHPSDSDRYEPGLYSCELLSELPNVVSACSSWKYTVSAAHLAEEFIYTRKQSMLRLCKLLRIMLEQSITGWAVFSEINRYEREMVILNRDLTGYIKSANSDLSCLQPARLGEAGLEHESNYAVSDMRDISTRVQIAPAPLIPHVFGFTPDLVYLQKNV